MRHQQRLSLTDAELERRRRPRTDIVQEQQDGPDRYVQARGPFEQYTRTLTVDPEADGTHTVTESFEWRLAIPVWRFLFRRPVRRTLVDPPADGRPPAWAPPDPFDRRATRILSLLALLAVFDGYLGAILSQTITFATDEFGNTRTEQGYTLAAVRAGVVIAIVLLALADRRGRRQLLLVCGLTATVLTVASGLAPSLWALGALQGAARGVTTALGILLLVVMAEELPAGSRAYGTSILALAAALGAGGTVWLLPTADLGEAGWRVIYLVPVVFLPAIWVTARRVPESRRFEVVDAPPASDESEHTLRRLALLGATGFFISFFAAPASQFRNDFLEEDRGMSGSMIALFSLVTYAPWALGVFLAGRLADVRGRRPVALLGLLGGALFTIAGYSTAGATLWIVSMVGNFVGAATIPSLGVYGPELFSTHRRGLANGLVTGIGVAGSSLGLAAVGTLADDGAFGAFGPAFTVAGVAVLAAAALIAFAFPETAHRELEELNPHDARPADRTREGQTREGPMR